MDGTTSDTALEVARPVLMALSDAYVLTDLDGEVLLANAAARRLLTATSSEDPRPVRQWTNDADLAAQMLARWRATSAPMPATFTLASGRALRGDGARLSGQSRLLIRLQDRDRSVAAYASIATQLRSDHLRALSRRLDATISELHDANRQLGYANEELQQYAAAVAHDVRTPLFTIRGFAQMIKEGGHADETGMELVDLLLASAERLHQTTESLLAVARLDHEPSSRGPTSLANALHEAVADLKAEFTSAGATLEESGLDGFVASVPMVSLRQVFQNLVANCLRFRDPDRPLDVVVSARLLGDVIEVAVTDNGIGVGDDEREHLFDLFQRGTRRDTTPGHGIGLATCRKLVSRWGGTIRCEPMSEPGARFVFTAPRVTVDRMPTPD